MTLQCKFGMFNRRVVFSIILTTIASGCFFSSQTIADIGDVYGRDLAIPGAGWAGHTGIQASNNLIYEMLRGELVYTSWGVNNELNRNNFTSFRDRSPFWGSRYATILHTPENYYRLTDYIVPNAILAYELGVDYTLTASYRRPVRPDETRWVDKGQCRGDTYVYDLYATGGVDLDLGIILPLRVFNAFPNIRLQPLQSELERPVNKPSLKYSRLDFPSVGEYSRLSFSEKIKMAEDLYRHPGLIQHQKKIVNLIEQEETEDLKNELMLLLYSAWKSKGQANLNDKQLSVRLRLFYQLLQNEVTREIAVRLGVGRILNHSQVKEMLSAHGYLFSENQRVRIINAYINNSILNGHDPFSDPILGDEVTRTLNNSDAPRRIQSLLATWSRLAGISDLSDLNTPFFQQHLASPPKNATNEEYINWVIAKSGILDSEEDRLAFIKSEYQGMSDHNKHLFITRSPYTKEVLQ